MRKEGYYWVKHVLDEWIIGLYNGSSWETTHEPDGCGEDELEEIDERRIVRDD